MNTNRHDALPRGFYALNLTQALGALNDNLFKLLLVLYLVGAGGLASGGRVATLAGALFVLPFLLATPPAGWLADRYRKNRILMACKALELAVMAVGLYGFSAGSSSLLYGTLFVMALQSALFGPAKYGIVPELVERAQLSRANGALESWTYLGIIGGTGLATVLPAFAKGFGGAALVPVGLALAGFVASLFIPRTPSASSLPARSRRERRLVWGTLRRDGDLRRAVLAAAAFLLLAGFVQLDLLPYGMRTLGLSGEASGALFLLTALGIAAGSLLAGRLSDRLPEMGLVPLGALGLTVALFGLGAATSTAAAMALLVLLGLSGGCFVVPLQTFLQWRSPARCRGRMLAVAGWLGWVGVLAAAGLLGLTDSLLGWTPQAGFRLVALVALGVALLTLRYLADLLLRFLVRLLMLAVYRLRVSGRGHIPLEGGALLVANHRSWADALVLLATTQRRIRFLMEREIYQQPLLRPLFRLMGVIPIAATDRPRQLAAALGEARQALDEGWLVAIFGEGAISRNGQLGPFKPGLERILRHSRHPLVPVALGGLEASAFGYGQGRPFRRWPRPRRLRVDVTVGPALPAATPAAEVRQAIQGLLCEQQLATAPRDYSLADASVRRLRRRWRREVMADGGGRRLTGGQALTAAVALGRKLARLPRPTPYLALALPASIGGALANLGATLAGRVPVNLNVTASREAVAAALGQCGCTTVLTSRQLLAKRPDLPLPEAQLYLEDLLTFSRLELAIAWLLARCCPRHRLAAAGPDDLATVLFSSGSTGRPKGVMLTHRNLLANIDGITRLGRLTEADRVLGCLPLFHAFGLTGTLWLPLCAGVPVTFHPNPLDAAGIVRLLRREGITLLLTTPTFLGTWARRARRDDFASLRLIITGAEKLRPELADSFERDFGVRPLEGYGATELAPVAAVNVPPVTVDGLKQDGSRPGSVGRPLPGTDVRILDPADHTPLALDAEGLIAIRGPQVMRGYLDDPERTEAVLRDGWYLTGDIGRLDTDGFLYITDRLSRFSKIAGEMVPHGAVEEALSHGLDTSSPVLAVTALPDPKRGERLVVLFTPAAGDGAALRQQARERLPNLWQPAAYLPVETLPLLGTGKLDLQGLRALAAASVAGEAQA